MLLKSIRLENIRSYISQNIEFPKGSVLLAGDIGSGKSTILLAIEFAFFGVKAGELSGSALLRHGAKEGAIQLNFDVHGKEIIIKRTLKRAKEKIAQQSGYIIIDGIKHELMPKELRAKIFELLGYPESLISKGDDLIYRYTVYTPQEQMKRIIYENKDDRLDTLRKVFNIDKYKRIKENTSVYIRSLREKRSNFEGRIIDMESKRKNKELLENSIKSVSEKESELSAKLALAKEKTSEKKTAVEKFESKLKEFNELKKESSILELQLKNVIERREKDQAEIEILKKNIQKLNEELKDYKDEPQLKLILEQKESSVEKDEKELLILRNEKSEIKGKITHLKQEAEKVISIDNCPLCMQKVSHEHKESIVGKSNSDINKLKETYNNIEEKEKTKLSSIEIIKRDIRELRERISLNNVLKVKKESALEKELKLKQLSESFDSSKANVAKINSAKLDLNKKLQLFSDIEKLYSDAKKEHDSALAEERKTDLEKNSISKEIEGIKKQVQILQNDIIEKEKIAKSLQKLINLQQWLEDKFINLVDSMEKHVMMTVYHEFNELFQRWFDILIEDENMGVRLDDSFSVVVEQNGYETLIENLSGGEKTSVALAYRLALNKVINDVVSQISTKDLLVLDEPTEGFSSAQLDRVRDVLSQIGISQIIIVSHEGKIESFVDNVIRINKHEGVSSAG